MKNLLLVFSFACALHAQVTVPIQMPGDAAVQVTLSAEAVSSTILQISGSAASGVPTTILTAAVTTTGQTAYTVASVSGVVTCMGAMIGTELSVITGISGNVLTVTRGTIGTSAATHLNGSAVTFTAAGNGSCFMANLLAAAIKGGMGAGAFPGPLVSAQKVIDATAQATITSTVAAGVTHAP